MQIEFPIIYTIAKEGQAFKAIGEQSDSLEILFETIINHIPGPIATDDEVPQFLVTSLDYDSYVGQILIGRLSHGMLAMNKTYLLCGENDSRQNVKFSALYTFKGLQKKLVETVEAGDIIALAGVENAKIGDTITSLENPKPLERIHVDEPTVSMIFYVNNSPFAGTEGQYLTTRHLKGRLEKELLRNVSIQVEPTDRTDAFEVKGRGELQMAILIETMRREGFEFMVSKPNVITKEVDGKIHEPFEHVFIDVPEEFTGVVTEKLSSRKGIMQNMINHGHGRVDLEFRIPARGLIGYRSQFLTDTKGSGIMNTLFDGYSEWAGNIPHRNSGALVADRAGRVTAYASFGMEDRGDLFIPIGIQVYMGMVIGERNKTGDLDLNITKEKKLSNMRASGSDNTVVLRPPRLLTLDQAIEFIADDELIEITPQNIRIRKVELDYKNRKPRRETE